MTSALGNNLSELDRLLLELNAVQQNSPSFPTTEEAAPPLPSCSITHYENGGAPEIRVSAPPLDKPKRNGARPDEGRPGVEELLGGLEGSVPVPGPRPSDLHSELDTHSQQQARISASCATRELDELMASLSDFKPSSLGPGLDQTGAFPCSSHSPVSFSVSPVASPSPSQSHTSPWPSSRFSMPTGFELHIDEEGRDSRISTNGRHPFPCHSPVSTLSTASETDFEPDFDIEVSANMLSSQLRSLVVLTHGASSNNSSNLLRTSSSPSTTPSLTSVNTVLDHKSSKSCSPSAERISPSSPFAKHHYEQDTAAKGPNGCNDLNLGYYHPTSNHNLSSPSSGPKTPSPQPAVTLSPSPPHILSKTASPSPVTSVTAHSPPTFNCSRIPSRELLGPTLTANRVSPQGGPHTPMLDPSLDEALDSLLAMSFPKDMPSEMDDRCQSGLVCEVQEDPILPMDRHSMQPDMFAGSTTTTTDGSLYGGMDGHGDLEWADEELSVSLNDGLDGTITPYTERPYTDGSMTPLTEASWMDESMTPSSCPGTPDVALDLPLMQPATMDRVSASGHLKSVIKRTKETANVHPVLRDGLLRRKVGPVIVNKSNSQDRLIEELQGKLGIGRAERRRKQQDDWLTEGVVVMSKPQRLRMDGAAAEVEKIIIARDLLIPQRKAFPPTSPPAPRRTPAAEEPPKRLPPARHPPAPTPPPLPPATSTHSHYSYDHEPLHRAIPAHHTVKPFSSPVMQPPAPAPAPKQQPPPCVVRPLATPPHLEPVPAVVPKVLVSVGCQTECDPIFPSMQISAQGKGSGPPTTQVNKLDNMLGSLQSDLNKLGVQTVAKGVCGACSKPIVGQVVTAMGRTWHPEHFVCTHCQEEIGSRNFFERDGQPYCEKDYHNLFSPRCYYCNGPILDKVVTALDRTWHPEHFFCAQCGSFFGPEGFHEKDGKAYCRKDYFDMFAPKCGGCARAILENYISALNSLWHPECFVCRECFTPFVNGSFFEHDGQPYCEVHYHERRGSLCSGCQKPITGRCITAMAKKFHPEHFVCAFCLKQLNKGTFKEQNDKPYCQGCFVKLFS
ncbi:uncharacterized protein pxnb isoform X2 [Gadus macrocephalus]|nr:uncharacterized protein pxnb isoform X2 [Gadus macrocephalus]